MFGLAACIIAAIKRRKLYAIFMAAWCVISIIGFILIIYYPDKIAGRSVLFPGPVFMLIAIFMKKIPKEEQSNDQNKEEWYVCGKCGAKYSNRNDCCPICGNEQEEGEEKTKSEQCVKLYKCNVCRTLHSVWNGGCTKCKAEQYEVVYAPRFKKPN